ncbi:MAG TPA: YIP1 family protein [Pyrinomonadaceae bacterium]|nr:YIP1 family protein [Pyrinomonadaceae bacterium]
MSSVSEPAFQAPLPPQTPPEELKAPRATYLWPFAIGAFLLGVAFILSSILKLIAGAWITGAGFCFLGVLLFGLSFIRMPSVPKKTEDAPLSLLQKVTGIFFEPTRVFRNLREYPLWIGAFLIMGVLAFSYQFLFVKRITPEVIVDHTRRQMESMGSLGGPPELREPRLADQLESMKNPVRLAVGTLNTFPLLFVLMAIGAGLSLLGVLAFGGRINFWQAFAVSVYTTLPVVVIQKILGIVILYLKSPDDLHPTLNRDTTLQDNLGILFSPSDHPVLFVAASFIGLTSFYALWLRAKGLHLGATRASSGTGWGVALTLWVLLLIFVVIITSLFPAAVAS